MMKDMPDSGAPIACDMERVAPEERPRHLERTRRLFHDGAPKRRAIQDGFAFSFSAEALDDVLRFVEQERRCCPFFSFSVHVQADRGPVRLEISSPAGGRDVVDSELLAEVAGD